jgi:hypothetical protein
MGKAICLSSCYTNKKVMYTKTLVIHPDDPSTDFLSPIYDNIFQATVVTGGVSKEELKQMIIYHDRVIMLGHGSPHGLFSVGMFRDDPNVIYPQRFNYAYVIDSTMVEVLNQKDNNVYIWCNADQFVNRHKLKGFYSGMFISEVSEATYCGLPGTEQDQVDQSNHYFAQLLGEAINDPLDQAYDYVLDNYGLLTEDNAVALYNYNRLYLNN